MKDIIQQIKEKYKHGEINTKLIFICVAIFILSSFINFIFFQNRVGNIEDFFAAKPKIEQFFSQPWGIISYAFFHGSFLHLLLNSLMLYFVGQFFLRYFRKEDFLTFFLFGSVFGALFFMIFSPLLAYNDGLIGASAAIYSLFFALIAYLPKNKIQFLFIPINFPLDYVGYALLAWDILMIIAGDNTGGHISHIGGAVFGFLYMKSFEKGSDFLGGIAHFFFSRNKIKTYQKIKTPPRDDYEFNSQKVEKQKKIDGILDKISRSGYESLTKEEKDFLFNAGK
ncbi:MAG: rhomboid family intramembrane serine protease [Weeksellaceae bacterium]|jgi:membrane associated rhomboid family serine protease|nr:rhomboid family intramembrane serine protease [Weeksellaceae bacterium]